MPSLHRENVFAFVFDRPHQYHSVFAWDYLTRQPLSFSPLRLPHHVYCMAFSPDGELVAFGHEAGIVTLMHYPSQTVVVTKKVGKDEQISCVEFSPDGAVLAAGSFDQSIYILDPLQRLRVVRRITVCKHLCRQFIWLIPYGCTHGHA
jgi:WD40 repeat protein